MMERGASINHDKFWWQKGVSLSVAFSFSPKPHKKEDDVVEMKHTLIIIFLSIYSYRTYKTYPQEPNLWESQHM